MLARPALHRREFVTAGAVGLIAASSLRAAPQLRDAPGLRHASDVLAAIEAGIGGRVGVAAWDTGTGVWVKRRADERFAMCSSFKLFLAATVLDRIDHGALTSGRKIPFSKADLLPHSPATSAHVGESGMSVSDLAPR